MTEGFSPTFNDAAGRKTLCLVALSDMWRRGVRFDRQDLAWTFNDRAKRICAAAQWHDLADNMEWPKEEIWQSLGLMVNLARQEGIDRIVLPLAERSEAGRFMKKLAKSLDSDGVEIDLFSPDSYVTRLHHLGEIDRRRKTALNFGLVRVME